MDSDSIIREDMAESVPEEAMANGYPPPADPIPPEEEPAWEPAPSPADSAFGERPPVEPPIEPPVGGGYGGPGTGGYGGTGGGYNDGPAYEPPVETKADKKTFLRASGSWTDILPIAALLSVIVLTIGEIISVLLIKNVIPAREIGMKLLGDADSVEFLLQYFEFFGIWIAFMLVAAVFKNNWPMWRAFFYNGHGNNLKAIPIGILLGFGMNGLCVLISCIMGDIKLSFNEFKPVVFLVFLFCVWIQSAAEEIIDRCYLYQKLRRRYRWPAIAVLGNALVFMALHMGNPSVTAWGLGQVFLFGVLASLFVYYWDSLWTAIWMHTAWNFSQSIVFGLPNSGLVSKYSVFKLEAASARDGLFYTTGFGVEGSKGANAIMAAVIVIVLIYGLVTKRGEREDHWAELEEREAGKNHIWEAVVLTAIMIAFLAGGFLLNRWWSVNGEQLTQAIEQVQEEQASQEPVVEEPATEQPAEVPSVEVPSLEVPTDGQEQQPSGQEEPSETPAAEQPGTETPAETPAAEQPGTETPAETPAAEQPAGQEQQPGTETPAAEQPAGQGQL